MYRRSLQRIKVKHILLVCLVGMLISLIYNELTPRFTEKITIQKSNLPTPIGFDLYNFYKNLERPNCEDYSLYVLNRYDDVYLAKYTNLSTENIINFVRDNITYCPDVDKEYPKYPIETIVEGCGDCEDKSILCANILYLKGLNISLIRYNNHMNILVNDTIVDVVSENSLYTLDNALAIYPIEAKYILAYDWLSNIYLEDKTYWIDMYIEVCNYGSINAKNISIYVNVLNVTRNIKINVSDFSCTNINLVFKIPSVTEKIEVKVS